LYSSLRIVQVALLLGGMVYEVFQGRKVLFVVMKGCSIWSLSHIVLGTGLVANVYEWRWLMDDSVVL
jgi:hypothetical protein